MKTSLRRRTICINCVLRLWRKTSLQIKTAMSSELSIFAARLQAFMDISLEDHGQLDVESARALAQHMDAEFNGMAMVLFALQFGRNLSYRALCEARGVTPNAVNHWSEIPPVPTAAFKELELTCLSPEQRTHMFHSSGTTGQRPSRHFHSAESLEVYEASLWAGLQVNLRFSIFDLRFICLTPSRDQAPHSSLVYMLEVVRHKLGGEGVFLGRIDKDGAWVLDYEAAFTALNCGHRPEEVETACVANPPPVGGYEKRILLAGTAFSFVHLLDELKARNVSIRLPEGSLVMETGGYKGRSREMPKAELHALITEHLGVSSSHIICEYGMSELSSQAYDCEMRSAERGLRNEVKVFHFPPWARARVVSPETGREVAEGETGLIRVFDLANVFSVMAIQTEDLAVRRGGGFELIGRANLAEPRGCSLMAT